MTIRPSLTFGEWTPDLPAHKSGLDNVNNAIFRGSHYDSMRGLSAINDNALPSYPIGAIAFKNINNNTKIYVATQSKIYEFNGSSFLDVSNTGSYNSGESGSWEFTVFNDSLVATNFIDPLQVKDLSLNENFSSLAGGPPKAKHMAKIGNFLVLGNITDNLGTFNNKVAWSGINNISEDWGDITKQSDTQFFNDTNGGAITKMIGGARYGIVFQEDAISRLEYVGGSLIFRRDTLELNQGTRISTSIALSRKNIFYIGKDGFYVFNGITSIPIGRNKVDNFFLNDCDFHFKHRISVSVENDLIKWSYPDKSSIDGQPNKLIIYNTSNSSWSKASIETSMVFNSLSADKTIDDLSDEIDDMDYNIDSSMFVGGQSVSATFNKNNQLCTFEGEVLNAEFVTMEVELNSGYFTRLQKLAPIINGGSSSLEIGERINLTNDSIYKPALSLNDNGCFTPLSTSVFHKFKLKTSGAFSTASGIQILESTALGKR